jgi:Tol biopolymer transport system component
VSRDGRIAFVVRGRRGWDVYVMDGRGRQKRRVARQHGELAYGPAWSADGRMILFVRTDVTNFDYSNAYSGLFVVNGDGTGLTRLEHSKSLGFAEWSPTQRTLAVEHSNAALTESNLTVADLRRHGARLTLRLVKTIKHVDQFRWAPDGRRIIYEDGRGFWVVDARRAQQRRPFAVRAYLATLAWSPDAQWLAYSRSRMLVKNPIEVATANGGERRIVTRRICCLLDQIAWAPR